MSIHHSLKASAKSKQHRSVLSRLERMLRLLQKGEWKGGDPIFGLAKVKIIKFKIKKEKAKEVEEVAAEAAAVEGAEAVEGAPAAEGKEAAKPAQEEAKPEKKKEGAK